MSMPRSLILQVMRAYIDFLLLVSTLARLAGARIGEREWEWDDSMYSERGVLEREMERKKKRALVENGNKFCARGDLGEDWV